MTTFKTVGRAAAALIVSAAIAFAATGAQAQSKGAPPANNGGFDGSTFSCLNYTNGLGENAAGKTQTTLARVWIQGYLAGLFKGQNKLEMSDDKADEDKLVNMLLQKCREYPASSVLAVSEQAIAKETLKMPGTVLADFSPSTYTCAQHTEAKKGGAGSANKADIAELWGVAFIQGFKNATQPDMVISAEARPALTGAVARNCEKNADMKYIDLTALVADKVKMQ